MKNFPFFILVVALGFNTFIDHKQTDVINKQSEILVLAGESQDLVREFCSLVEISCKYDSKNTPPKREIQSTGDNEPTPAIANESNGLNQQRVYNADTEKGLLEPADEHLADVYVTAYSRESSCHNPKGDKCLMASGKDVYEGAIACPRHWPLGTKVYLPGLDQVFTCEDRYSLYLDEQRGLPTIDVFMNNHLDAVTFGKQRMTAKVL